VSSDDDGPSEQEVRDALRALRDDDEPSLDHVLTLVVASVLHEKALVPGEVVDAISAQWAIEDDLANGGMDQVVWNIGHERARQVARSFRAVGAIENADLVDRLSAVLEQQQQQPDGDAEPVTRFMAFRRAVSGPFFGVPELEAELGEVVLEFVLERVDSLPDPDGPLGRRAQ